MLFGAGLGLPIPEEIPILAAGALAAGEVVRWWIALPIALLGVLGGDVALYWIGRHWGEHILDWRIVRLMLTREREERLKTAYHRHGLKIIFTARHITGVRAAAFLTAGIVRIPFGRFIAVDGGAALVGVPASFGIAFLFTDQLERLVSDIHRAERWAMLIGLAILAGWIGVIAYRRARRTAAAERL